MAISGMAFNPFIGRDQGWLEARLRETQDELGSGKSTISSSLGEASFGKIMTIGPMERLKLILAALNRLNPTAYPIDSVTAPTRTIATFTRFT